MDSKKIKQLLLRSLPLILVGWVGNKISMSYRTAPGSDLYTKFSPFIDRFSDNISSPLPSFNLIDLFVGICAALLFWAFITYKRKNRKNYRYKEEYGGAKWGTEKDIQPYMDAKEPDNNVILTQTERLTMGKPKSPKYARNKNIEVIGGSGSGKTRFFVKPNLITNATSSVEKVNLRNQIAKLQVTLNSVNERISKLTAMAAQLDKLAALPADQADKVIDNAVKGVDQQLATDQSMTVQETTDTVINEAGKAVKNNDIEQQGLDKEQETIAKLNGEISDDLAFFGEVTYETAQHIKEAGYVLKDGTLQKAEVEKNEEHKEVNQQEHTEKQNETHTDKQAKTALDVAALCAAIPVAFAENHDMQTRLLHTR